MMNKLGSLVRRTEIHQNNIGYCKFNELCPCNFSFTKFDVEKKIFSLYNNTEEAMESSLMFTKY